eukprot:2056380-Prymnesium_polylepis.1
MSTQKGGGLFVRDSADVRLVDVTFDANTAPTVSAQHAPSSSTKSPHARGTAPPSLIHTFPAP